MYVDNTFNPYLTISLSWNNEGMMSPRLISVQQMKVYVARHRLQSASAHFVFNLIHDATACSSLTFKVYRGCLQVNSRLSELSFVKLRVKMFFPLY